MNRELTPSLVHKLPSRSLDEHYDRHPRPVEAEEAYASEQGKSYVLPTRSIEGIRRFNILTVPTLASVVERANVDYHSLYVTVDPDEKCVALVGKTGSASYIVDPRTFAPLTPGYHFILKLGRDEIITDDEHYITVFGSEKTPEVPAESNVFTLDVSDGVDYHGLKEEFGERLENLQWAFPVTYQGRTITCARLRSKLPVLHSAQEKDTFNINGKESLHPNIVKANGIYESVMEKVIACATSNKALRHAFSEDVLHLALPFVHNNSRTQTRLTIAQSEAGNTQLIFNGYHLDGRLKIDSGFHLVRDHEGNSLLVPMNDRDDVPIDSSQYADQLDAAEKALSEYFEKLNVQKKLGVNTLNLSLPELGSHIHNQSRQRARHILKAVLGKG